MTDQKKIVTLLTAIRNLTDAHAELNSYVETLRARYLLGDEGDEIIKRCAKRVGRFFDLMGEFYGFENPSKPTTIKEYTKHE